MKIFAKKAPPQKGAAPGGGTGPTKNAPVFDVRENQLCAELKISKDELRRRREYFLVQGTHWDYVDKRVMVSQIGAQILRGTKNAVVPETRPAGASTADNAKPRRPIALLCAKNPPPVKFEGKLIVWSTPGFNRHVVVCYLPGTDPYNPMNLVTLRVRDHGNFMRGMQIPDVKPPGNKVHVNAVSDRENTYELQGPLPRYRGRW